MIHPLCLNDFSRAGRQLLSSNLSIISIIYYSRFTLHVSRGVLWTNPKFPFSLFTIGHFLSFKTSLKYLHLKRILLMIFKKGGNTK